MRILFMTPYPPSRIRVRSYGFLMQLQREHFVTVVTQCASEREMADVEVLRRQGCEVVVVQETRWKSALRSGSALLSSQPLQVAYARSTSFRMAVEHLFAERAFDVVHVEHLRGIASLNLLAAHQPLVWDAVDCISFLFKHASVAGPNLPVRTMALLEQKRTQRYETQILHQLKHVVVTSERDRQAMLALQRTRTANLAGNDEYRDGDIHVLSNGVDLEYFHPTPQEPRPFNVVFSGKMSYHANIAAALFLHRQIMPLIWQKRPEATLTIVGSKPPKEIQQMARDPRVEVTGYVDDMRQYIRQAGVVVCPMVYSVGIQNKVLEAMALGMPVVAAAQAAAALDARPADDMLIAESAEEYAGAALRVMEDAQLRSMLCHNGRKYVEESHDWRAMTDRLLEIYRCAIAAHGEKTSPSRMISLV